MNKHKSSVATVWSMLLLLNAYRLPAQATFLPAQDTVLKKEQAHTNAFMEGLLQTGPSFFRQILQNRKPLNVQIIYTQIDRRPDNQPIFRPFYFNVDEGAYFYPASTVKLPVAVLALQKLHELSLPGVDKNSTLITEAAYSKQSPSYNDPAAKDGRPTIAQFIKKIFMVSDNNAFNRLYEFIGQQSINDKLHKMGYADAEILHRLQVSMSPDENRHTNPIGLYNESGSVLYTQPMLVNETRYSVRHDSAGIGFFNNGQLVNHAMDFSGRNRLSLQDLTNMLKSVLFPRAVTAKQRFNLTDDDYRFLKQYMSEWPTESSYPPYNADTAAYWPALDKFLLYGAEKGPVPPGIRIFNKIGGAYGFLTDIAYVVDFNRQIEFMLSATIYCNTDGILNDDRYDYETLGMPFMKQLGKMIYEYELNRPRAVKPDLTAFKINYDN
ncbi:MAG: serine hydrolase [Bacteroidota bacterium]